VAAAAVCGLHDAAVERLRTAVAETVMNAIEHGNGERPEVDVDVAVWRTSAGVRVEVTDQALTGRSVDPDAPAPDLELKLAGLQTPRGWGLFLVRSMVDAVDERSGPAGHTVRLHLRRDAR
jgi:anti-sigma regulatory factor (Ser/Thr protein kinase)